MKPGFSGLRHISAAVYAFAASRLRDGYSFSVDDLALYLRERFTTWRPAMEVISCSEPGLVLLEIAGRRIFWPSILSYSDLRWLFGEVYTPWAVNPSSYDHPALEFRTAEWVIDAGACEGFFSLFALEQGARSVIAVEPLRTLWPALGRTFAEYHVAGRYHLFEGGLGKETGTAYMDVDPHHACDGTMVECGHGQSVSVVTLDDLCEQYALKSGGLLKMDIEGAEMDVLYGATGLLRMFKPKLAIAVYHGFENARLCARIIRAANPSYTVEFRGMYSWTNPARPYMLFAW